MSKRSIVLSDESEKALYELATALGTGSEEATLGLFVDAFLPRVTLRGEHGQSGSYTLRHGQRVVRLDLGESYTVEPITADSQVMEGDSCIRHTRIPVWMLVEYKRQGLTDSELLAQFPGLNAADLATAWDFFAAHSREIEAQRLSHDQ